MARPTRSSRRTASMSAAWSAGVIWVVSNSGVMGALSFFESLRLLIKNGGFAEGIKGRINLVCRRKLKSSAFQFIANGSKAPCRLPERGGWPQ